MQIAKIRLFRNNDMYQRCMVHTTVLCSNTHLLSARYTCTITHLLSERCTCAYCVLLPIYYQPVTRVHIQCHAECIVAFSTGHKFCVFQITVLYVHHKNNRIGINILQVCIFFVFHCCVSLSYQLRDCIQWKLL